MGLTNYAVSIDNLKEANVIVESHRKLHPKTDRAKTWIDEKDEGSEYYLTQIKWKWAPVEPFLGLDLCDGPYKSSLQDDDEDEFGQEQGQRGIGGASFRGKVYDDTIQSITGQTVYRYLLLPFEVADMADKFKQHLLENKMTDPSKLDREELEEFNLWGFFEVCKENNFGILGSW